MNLSDYALPFLDMVVVFDDGRRMEAHADQRDMRRGTIAIGTDPASDPLGFSRSACWAYLVRKEQLDGMGWRDFDAQVSFVIPLEEETSADPTQTATD